MKEVIYLVISRYKVERMTKNLHALGRGEIPVKVVVEVEETAFRTPVIEKKVYVEDWREGIDIVDIDFKETAITPEEAEVIKQRRLETMRGILEHQGYTVTKPEATG
jgi:hypothetical protein